MTHQPTLRTPTEGRTIAVVGDMYRFLATGDDTNGKYAFVAPGGGRCVTPLVVVQAGPEIARTKLVEPMPLPDSLPD